MSLKTVDSVSSGSRGTLNIQLSTYPDGKLDDNVGIFGQHTKKSDRVGIKVWVLLISMGRFSAALHGGFKEELFMYPYLQVDP